MSPVASCLVPFRQGLSVNLKLPTISAGLAGFSLSSSLPSAGVTGMPDHTHLLYLGADDLNPGLYVLAASTLIMEPFPQPLVPFM